MKDSTQKIKHIPYMYCQVFGHTYEVSKKVTKHVKEYTCTCCNKQLTTNSDGNLTPLTGKYREINSVLENIYFRRKLRFKEKILVSSIY